MIVKHIEEAKWKDIEQRIMKIGRFKPLMAQIELDISCNGSNFTLLVQLENDCKIVVLQALREYIETDDDGDVYKSHSLEEDEQLLSKLLELIVFENEQKK